MKHKNYYSVQLPTSNPNQCKWIRYKLKNLYPGPTPICHTDPLALRQWIQTCGYRMPKNVLKIHIKKNLGFKGWCNQ